MARPTKKDSLIPQARLLRLFQVIAVLKKGKWSIQALAARFDMHERTIYRYIKLLIEVEFPVEQGFDNRYFIATSEDQPGDNEFTTEEMKLVKKLIQGEVDNNPLRAKLIRKLSLNSELDKVPRIILKARLGKLVEKIAEAIRARKQVILKNYHSANSREITDRLIEPIDFGDNYETIIAFDTKDKKNKRFKLDRIGEVIVHSKTFAYPDKHEHNKADIFGVAGKEITWITLKMKMRPYLLLREEHPLSISYIEKLEDGDWQFHGPVSSFDGVGRFVMGLFDEVKIIAPKDFVAFVRAKIRA